MAALWAALLAARPRLSISRIRRRFQLCRTIPVRRVLGLIRAGASSAGHHRPVQPVGGVAAPSGCSGGRGCGSSEAAPMHRLMVAPVRLGRPRGPIAGARSRGLPRCLARSPGVVAVTGRVAAGRGDRRRRCGGPKGEPAGCGRAAGTALRAGLGGRASSFATFYDVTHAAPLVLARSSLARLGTCPGLCRLCGRRAFSSSSACEAQRQGLTVTSLRLDLAHCLGARPTDSFPCQLWPTANYVLRDLAICGRAGTRCGSQVCQRCCLAAVKIALGPQPH